MTYRGEYINEDCYRKMALTMGLPENAAWFVYEIFINNQDELHFTAFELSQEPKSYRNNEERRNAFLSKLPKDGKRQFILFTQQDLPCQQIYYGAPGTGKSHAIKEQTAAAEKEGLVFRTTFHPDSDYSTFVGAYKPVMRPVADKYKAVAGKDEEITYSYVPQAFLQAYIAAWNNQEEKVFLIIEEINRGNCAQIFGDLFQLLDRGDDGFSEYPIKADTDLKSYLEGKDENGKDVLSNKDGIKDGKLLLPSNLYIWATMNTSDQSLFPIDSAFKRRWDWVYMPIDTRKETWHIVIGDKYYSWSAFLEKINNEILTDETAEDKHLGFYFCKAVDNEIAVKTFVGKVLFYLWNDVFKVYGIPSAIGSSKEWAYTKFYHTDGSVDEAKVEELMRRLKIGPEGEPENEDKE
ncbi:MAG: AAA family ATPase [Prevotella sp.]|nr:AAA family ATPase [Prevotella sp.]